MKNQLYSRQGIYDIIRSHYLRNFPYTIQFEALNAINEHISLIIDSASIQKMKVVSTYLSIIILIWKLMTHLKAQREILLLIYQSLVVLKRYSKM